MPYVCEWRTCKADMSSIANGSHGSLCHSLPASGHRGLAVTCWEPEAVRSVLEAAQGWGRLCEPTAMGNHHFKAFTLNRCSQPVDHDLF